MFGLLICVDTEGRVQINFPAAPLPAILAARKLSQVESTRPTPTLNSIIADAVIFAERIMQRIDALRRDRLSTDEEDEIEEFTTAACWFQPANGRTC
jgi:hypothetical protein